MQKTIKLGEANGKQLFKFAKEVLGLDVTTRTPVNELRSQIQACGKDEILVMETIEPEVAPKPDHPELLEPVGRKMVKVLISLSEEPGGDEPVPLGCNGKVMLVPRGEQVEIPEEYFESLKNAVYDHYEPMKDGGMSSTPRKVQSYPYQVIG